MRIERLQVSNHERWGKLVKTWATGTNYLEDDNTYPVPETVDEFKEQLAKAQALEGMSESIAASLMAPASVCISRTSDSVKACSRARSKISIKP